MKRLTTLILIIFFAGCELFELPITVEPAEERMVLSSLMLGENAILLAASRSFSALSARSLDDLEENFVEAIMVNRGYVMLHNGRDSLELQQFGLPGFYFGTADFLAIGDSLHVSVYDSLRDQTVTASTRFMEPVAIDSAGMQRVSDGEFATNRLKIRFDESPVDQFFSLHVYNASSTLLIEEMDSLFFHQENLLLHSSVFTDRAAVDGVIRREIDLDAHAGADTVVVVLSNVEEGYFRFLDALRRAEGIVAALANEPVNLPGNVNGGYGYFSAHQPRARVVISDTSSEE